MHLRHGHLVSNFESTLIIDLTISDTLRELQLMQTQVTNMFKRIEPQESSQIRYPKTNTYHNNNHCRQVHLEHHQHDYHLGYFKYEYLDERVMSPNKIEASTFEGRHDPLIFDMWIHDMDQFFEWHNLSDNKRVRFAKMILISEVQLYWRDVDDLFRDKR